MVLAPTLYAVAQRCSVVVHMETGVPMRGVIVITKFG